MQYSPAIAGWAKGVVLHHTWRPLPSQWQGQKSMEGLARFYAQKGWDAGPHLFIVYGSPNGSDDGIWQLTALNEKGVHAGECNATKWGIEVVGDYDKRPWDVVTEYYVLGVVSALMKWKNLPITPYSILGHRDCNSPKSCPGNTIDMAAVRNKLTHLVQG